MSTGQHPQAAPEPEPEAKPEQDILRIVGVPPYDGDWPCDISKFTNRELRRIKQVSGGIKAAQLRPALIEGDQDALVGITAVMLDRASKFTVVVDLLLDADSEAIEFIAAEGPEPEGEEADPNSQTPSEQSDELLGTSEPSAATTSSGESGEAGTATTEETTQSPTGSQSSESLPSDPEISES